MGGSDSKLHFKEKLDQLITEKLSVDDNRFWNSLLHAPLEVESIEESLSIAAIRELRQQHNPNLEYFFVRVLRQLNATIDEGTYGRTPLSRESQQTALTCIRLLTRIIPVLLEIPLVHPGGQQNTADGYSREEMDEQQQRNVNPASDATSPPIYREAYEGSHSESGGLAVDSPSQSEAEFLSRLFWQTASPNEDQLAQTEKSETSILAVQILTALQRLLFLNGFTVSTPSGVIIARHEILPKHKVDARFLWKGGIGAMTETVAPATPAMLQARTEVLRCILGCLSSTLYTTVEEYQSGAPPLWLWMFTRGYLLFTANLYCSLMSTVFSYDPYGEYGFGFFSSGSGEEELVSVSLQVLCALLDFNFSIQQEAPPLQRSQQANKVDKQLVNNSNQSCSDPRSSKQARLTSSHNGVVGGEALRSVGVEADTTPKGTNSTVIRNAYRLMLAGMKRESELDLIFNGVIRLLSTVSWSKSTYFGGAKMFAGYQELLILLWHLLTINTHFCRRITSRVNVNQVLQPLLIVLLENSTARRLEVQQATSVADTLTTTDTDRSSHLQQAAKSTSSNPLDQERIGLLHLCCFILLVLSSEREFAVGLNSEYNEKFPLRIPAFRGCYADLLVIVTHRVILDSLGSVVNDSLIDMLLTVLCNISAYIKSFCLESCVKLLILLNRFSKPSWLFRASYHYHNVFFLLDILNNAVQYQYEGNLCMVYSILRQKDLFIDLQNLTFPKSLESVASPSSTNTTNTATELSQNNAISSIDPSISSVVWKPTEKWFIDWKSRLPLHTLSRLISCLLPMVEAECQERDLINQSEVLEYLKRTTMVGLFPVPHAIIIRSYFANEYTTLWFSTYTWSVIVARTQHLNLFDPKAIRFFSVAIG